MQVQPNQTGNLDSNHGVDVTSDQINSIATIRKYENKLINMPPNEPTVVKGEDTSQKSTSSTGVSSGFGNFFSIPLPVKLLFDKVPMVVYAPNELPQRAPRSARVPSLYVFSTVKDAAAGRPSFNPSCLKWQVCFPSEGHRAPF